MNLGTATRARRAVASASFGRTAAFASHGAYAANAAEAVAADAVRVPRMYLAGSNALRQGTLSTWRASILRGHEAPTAPGDPMASTAPMEKENTTSATEESNGESLSEDELRELCVNGEFPKRGAAGFTFCGPYTCPRTLGGELVHPPPFGLSKFLRACVRGIEDADAVFALADDAPMRITALEVGVAARLGKRVFLGSGRQAHEDPQGLELAQLFFEAPTATVVCGATPLEAWRVAMHILAKDLR